MRGGEAVDGKFLAAGFGEVEKAADVIILVVTGKQPLRFGVRESKSGKNHRFAKFTGVLAIETD